MLFSVIHTLQEMLRFINRNLTALKRQQSRGDWLTVLMLSLIWVNKVNLWWGRQLSHHRSVNLVEILCHLNMKNPVQFFFSLSQLPVVVWSRTSQWIGLSPLVSPTTTAITWPATGCWRLLRAKDFTFTLRRWLWQRMMIGKKDILLLHEDGWTWKHNFTAKQHFWIVVLHLKPLSVQFYISNWHPSICTLRII